MSTVIQQPGSAAYKGGDDTRNWVETHRHNGVIKPALMVRFATDTNYLSNTVGYPSRLMTNLALPGQRVPGILTWQVDENYDQVTQGASMEILNCLPVSERQTHLAASLEGSRFSTAIKAQWASDSFGVPRKINAGDSVSNHRDPYGYYYREENVKYRSAFNQTFTVVSAAGFPNPAVPDDDDNDVTALNETWPHASNGVGAYYVMIDDEIIRVINLSANTFTIPPGGRGIGGSPVQAHITGAAVTLLGYGPTTNEVAGIGYLNVDDWRPQSCIMRPGTCLVSYEGYGVISAPLSHTYDPSSNYAFTGYWFISAVEPSMSDDGVPRIRVDLKSAGNMFDKQRISPDILRRAKNQFGQWRIAQEMGATDGQTIWGAAGHDRQVPGDWVDYNSWDPSLPGSYPMKVSVELAQHKEFYDHMLSTDFGNQCEICRQEHAEWLKTHASSTTNPKNFILEQRAIGKHIYKQSIRVLREDAGPVKTYIRLLATIAMAAWDHPAYGTELSQAFTKIPNKLFDNMRNIHTGLVFNGQVGFRAEGESELTDWTTPGYDDVAIASDREPLTCPFESTYDKTSFAQPMQELAELNDANFWVNRCGYPVFKPRLFSFRPSGHGYKDLDRSIPYPGEDGNWFQTYGGSISGYSHNVNPENIVSQAWVTGTSAFGSSLTILTGGTGPSGSRYVKYSGLGGNSMGLALTSGVQQVDTLSIDNQILGLDWNTNASGWGAVEQTATGDTRTLNALPPMYDGSPNISKTGAGSADAASKHPVATKRIQQTINFFLVRHYFIITSDPKQLTIDTDGKWDDQTTAALKSLQSFLRSKGYDSATVDGINISVVVDGVYGRSEYLAIKDWLKHNQHYIQFDIWWYVQNKRPWEEYLSAITGVPIQLSAKKGTSGEGDGIAYAIDDKGTQQAVGEWTKTFGKNLVSAGNRHVDNSINQAIVRTISSNIADPRIQPGDVIWADVPGFIRPSPNPPYTNGIWVLTASRQMDLQAGTYTATYSGHRYIGGIKTGLSPEDTNGGYGYITNAGGK